MDQAQVNAYTRNSTEFSLSEVVELPCAEKFKSKFEELGITWLESRDFTASAKLPVGWKLIENGIFRILIDNNKCTVAKMFIKSDWWDRESDVTFFEERLNESQDYLDEEITQVEVEAKIDPEAVLINKHRLEKWSVEHPYCVVYTQNLQDYRIDNTIRRFCHGYFSSELANRAVDFLKKDRGFRDSAFCQKFDQDPQLEIRGYQTVNGFIEDSWKKF